MALVTKAAGEGVTFEEWNELVSTALTAQKLSAGVDGAVTSLATDGPVVRCSSLTIAGTETTANGRTLVYVQGDAVISGTLTLKRGDDVTLLGDPLAALLAGDGASPGSGDGGGGGGFGAGGASDDGGGTGGAGYTSRISTNLWKALQHLMGGDGADGTVAGGAGGLGGGSLILIVDGDLTHSGIIDASGANGATISGKGGGGGGAGSVQIFCTGTLYGAGGTIIVSGGNGAAGEAAGGGAGGYAAIVAAAISTAPTITTTGGSGYNNGAAGLAEQVTSLTAGQIRNFLRSAGL